MTQEKQSRTGMLDPKYRKVLLVILAALFTFGGPYAVYVLVNVLEISHTYSIISGFALFIVGLMLIRHLIKNKIIS